MHVHVHAPDYINVLDECLCPSICRMPASDILAGAADDADHQLDSVLTRSCTCQLISGFTKGTSPA